jgi:hypothetical protein
MKPANWCTKNREALRDNDKLLASFTARHNDAYSKGKVCADNWDAFIDVFGKTYLRHW